MPCKNLFCVFSTRLFASAMHRALPAARDSLRMLAVAVRYLISSGQSCFGTSRPHTHTHTSYDLYLCKRGLMQSLCIRKQHCVCDLRIGPQAGGPLCPLRPGHVCKAHISGDPNASLLARSGDSSSLSGRARESRPCLT